VYRVRMDQILNDDAWSLFDVFDSHSSDLGNLYEELFVDEELIPELENELPDYGNLVLIRSILFVLEYRGQGLGGLLALKPWPMTADDQENVAGAWELPRLSPAEQKTIAGKLRKSYMKAGFKPLFTGSEHLILTHLRHPTATELNRQVE